MNAAVARFCALAAIFVCVRSHDHHHHRDCHLQPPPATVVETVDGPLNGTLETSSEGREYLAFKGVPYARPPVGALRFKPPQPVARWSHVRDAHAFADVCLQKDTLTARDPAIVGSEDCLYLNVYAPARRHGAMPVMVFVHWGAFITGNGNERAGPQYFMDKDVVLVTFNYRLGVFGLLSTGDDASPGNYAFKDQNAVLRWVRRNARAFGGDPDDVTLFGQSAGGGSTHLHILSPMSRGLFHKGISQSGTALSLWSTPNAALQQQVARQHAALLRCNGTTQEMVECLRAADANDLLESYDAMKYFYSEPISLYTPAVEKRSRANPEPFLERAPIDYITEGDFANVPWILGVVADEGILRVSPFLRNADIKAALLSAFDAIAPNLMGVSLSAAASDVDAVWRNLSAAYFGNASSSATFLNESVSIQAFIDMYSDRGFNYGAYQSALLHAAKGHRRLYFYVFDYKGEHTHGDVFAMTDARIDFDWKVCHCDDLLYLFNDTLIDKKLNRNDALMRRVMVQLWTNFATFGNPTPNEKPWLPMRDLSSEKYLKNEHLTYLNISGPYERPNPIVTVMESRFYKERMRYLGTLPLNENVDNIV